MLLPELIDHIIYFTTNSVSDLSLVNKYFNDNVKKIRIISNKDYPKMKNEYLQSLPNLTELYLPGGYVINYQGIRYLKNLKILDLTCTRSPDERITDSDLSKITSLTHLGLSYNRIITDEGISGLTNLTFLDLAGTTISDRGIMNLNKLEFIRLSGNTMVTNDGLARLSSLTDLNLYSNDKITFNESMYRLKKLTLGYNFIILDDELSKLTNLEILDLEFNKIITDKGVSNLVNLKDLFVNDLITNEGISNLTNLRSLALGNNTIISNIDKNIRVTKWG